jgi:hypothetical protein
METTKRQLKCGNCGNEKHTLYLIEERESILAKCVKCNNLSEITVVAPKIQIDWVDGSDGILAVF